jgi:hypothetical protein
LHSTRETHLDLVLALRPSLSLTQTHSCGARRINKVIS